MSNTINGKTVEQRRTEIQAKLRTVENALPNSIPADIASIVNDFEGINVLELLGNMPVSKAGVREVTTKKGKKLYEIFSTGGFELKDIGQINGHTLAAKVSVFIR
jgi:hypothetical protein